MKMKKVLIAFVCLLFTALFLYIDAYSDAVSSKNESEQRAMKQAEKQGIIHIDDVYTYRGSDVYVIVIGKNDEGEQMIAWVTEKGKIVDVRKASEGITKQQAQSSIKTYHPKEVVSVKLGMEKGIPLWEITYIDERDRYSFYYVRFEDGAFLKRYHFARGKNS
ncbi:copper amine oxidase [Anoxybacillus sp. CHMUD]|nr:copper amine oxidase [Anoxybacillus sp. CHMUD]